MSKKLWLASLLLAVLASADSGTFLVKPYLQLGDRPKLARKEGLTVMWHAPDRDEIWTVQVRNEIEPAWRAAENITFKRVAVRTVDPHRVYSAEMNNLEPGGDFFYKISLNGRAVFESRGRARKAPHQFYNFAIFGDCGAGTPGQRDVAYRLQALQQTDDEIKLDLVVIPGDIVYSRGRVSEYATKFWPVYNADTAKEAEGAPLMRSTLFIGAPGNHDIASTDVTEYPDGLAYFYNWAHPMNGPALPEGHVNMTMLKGTEEDRVAFKQSAGATYPRMASFSYDYGNTHWTVLDSNKNVDWSVPEAREWLEADLKTAAKATWRFVVFHHPGFNSSKAHFTDQWMRLLAPVFEKGKVDVVWSGHVHNYQRSFPLTYKPGLPGETPEPGWYALDKAFDGAKQTKPKGVLYVVTGAGGAGLYNKEQGTDPSTWQPFTTRFVSDRHSFTFAEMRDRKLTVRQLDSRGDEIDRFVISK